VEIELEIAGVYAPAGAAAAILEKAGAGYPGAGGWRAGQVGNLATLLRGAIEFDRLGTGRSSHQLFDSKEQAKAKVRTLSLVADSNPGLGSAAHPLPRGRHRQD
jgi:hypothetical protein